MTADTFFCLGSTDSSKGRKKICKNVTYPKPHPLVFLLRHYFHPWYVTVLHTTHVSSLSCWHQRSDQFAGVCVCVCLLQGGRCRGPGGSSEDYVWERDSMALPGLSPLLMMAVEWTSHTPSPCASHTSSSSTTLTPGSLTPTSPWLTSPQSQCRSQWHHFGH